MTKEISTLQKNFDCHCVQLKHRLLNFGISLALTFWAGALSAGAMPEAFANWPKGLDPQTVGGRVVAQFLSTEPECYNAKGFNAAAPYGGGKYVV